MQNNINDFVLSKTLDATAKYLHRWAWLHCCTTCKPTVDRAAVVERPWLVVERWRAIVKWMECKSEVITKLDRFSFKGSVQVRLFLHLFCIIDATFWMTFPSTSFILSYFLRSIQLYLKTFEAVFLETGLMSLTSLLHWTPQLCKIYRL
jgi:hypothetical protein